MVVGVARFEVGLHAEVGVVEQALESKDSDPSRLTLC